MTRSSSPFLFAACMRRRVWSEQRGPRCAMLMHSSASPAVEGREQWGSGGRGPHRALTHSRARDGGADGAEMKLEWRTHVVVAAGGV